RHRRASVLEAPGLMKRGWLLLGALLGAGNAARANGRPPAPISTAIEPAPGQRLLIGTTFGVLVSSDQGATWRWICEQAVYNSTNLGMFDPRYLVSPTGTVYAALSSGLSLSRDGGCSWQYAGGPLAGAWIGDVATSPVDVQTVYAVTSTTRVANGLFMSHDDRRTWAPVGTPDPVAYYGRVVAVGADAYISGYDSASPGGSQHLWKYTGATGALAATTGYVGLESAGAILEHFGASQRTPGLLYLKAKAPGGLDAAYKSADGGMHWVRIYAAETLRATLLDQNDTLWLATATGAQPAIVSSTDGGTTWVTGATDRMFGCLGKRGGTLYGCVPNATGWAFGQSQDGLTWSPLLRFSDLQGVLACPAGSLTHDLCEPLWPTLAMQLGVGSGGDGGAGAPGAGGHGGGPLSPGGGGPRGGPRGGGRLSGR